MTDEPIFGRRSFVRAGVLAAGALSLGVPAFVGTATAAKSGRRPGTIPVFADDIDGDDAIFYRIAQAGSAADEFVTGPAPAPFGSGSLQLTTSGPGDRLFLYNYDYGIFSAEGAVALADITALSYSSYVNDDTLVPALKIEIDPSGNNDYGTLNFEPYYGNTVTPETWQTWDVLTAGASLWVSGTSGEGSISQPVTWTRLLELYPDATIKYGFGVGVGSGWGVSDFVGHVDDLTIGVDGETTRYNFEPRGNSGNGGN